MHSLERERYGRWAFGASNNEQRLLAHNSGGGRRHLFRKMQKRRRPSPPDELRIEQTPEVICQCQSSKAQRERLQRGRSTKSHSTARPDFFNWKRL